MRESGGRQITPEMIPDSLRTAYLRAVYSFGEGPSRLELRPGRPCEPLRHWMQDNGLRCVAVLTAFNPGSRSCDSAFNSQAQRALRARISSGGLPYREGCNLDPTGAWPPEDSLLVGNLSLQQARELAREFGQLAFLWSDEGAVPRLIDTGES